MTARNMPSRGLFTSLFGAILLIFLWHRNYNIIGDTYDYSIVTSACGYLHAGLKPYRDFTTPLQSLTIYLCYAGELIFGRRYLALAYMNLALGMAFYFILIYALRDYVSPGLRALAATALCAATYFQHGILWYNSLAISLLMLLFLCAAIIYRRQRLDRPAFICLCLLLYFSSMCKLNYHVLALAVVGGILALFFLTVAPERKKAAWVVPGALFFGLVAGPITEILINRTTPHDFLRCVVLTPRDRLKNLINVLDPNTLLGKVADFYPDNWCSGVYLFALLIFGSCFYFFVRQSSEAAGANQSDIQNRMLKYFGPLAIAGFYFTALMITMTNRDIEWLTASSLVAGLLATLIMFGSVISLEQGLCLRLGLFLLAGFFAVGASASAFMHSRVRLGEPGWTKTLIAAVWKERKLSALKTAVPFYDAEQITPDFVPYLGGTYFSGAMYPNMLKIAGFVKKYDLKAHPQKVYWGSGLQIMNRVYDDVPIGRFPLWYHFNVTVRNQDAPAIIEAFKKNDYDWVFSTHWIVEMPDAVQGYLTNNYQSVGDDNLVVYCKKGMAGKF